MAVTASDLWVPPPPRRAVLRASAVTAAAMAATVLPHVPSPVLRTAPRPAAAPACYAFSPSARARFLVLAASP